MPPESAFNLSPKTGRLANQKNQKNKQRVSLRMGGSTPDATDGKAIRDVRWFGDPVPSGSVDSFRLATYYVE